MTFEAVFLSGYADLLLLAALGLHRLGRINPSPWAGRVLAGHRRRHPEAAVPRDDDPRRTWPLREQPRLHTGIALVATTAALVLGMVGLWRYRDATDTLLFSVPSVAALVVLHRLGRTLAGQPR